MDWEDSTNPAHKLDPEFALKSPLLSSPLYEYLREHQDDKDDQPLPPPILDTPTIDPIQSTSERARERYLKKDPLALVLSPSSVECRQCKKKIKLSSKSAYDSFHWRNHRTRCMKAYKRKVKVMNKVSTSKKSLTPLSSLHKGGLIMHTSPLTSDCDDDRLSDGFEVHTCSPTPSSSFAPPKQALSFAYSSQPLDTTFSDYLRRSHPDYAQPAASIQNAGRWRNWSWSQLKPPQFPVADYDNYDDDMDEDDPYSFEISSNIFREASSLSFVS